MKIHRFWHVLWTAWKPLVILKKGVSKEGISYSGGIIIARGSRFFLKFSAVPLPGETDNAYNIQMVTCLIVPTRLKTRGAAQ